MSNEAPVIGSISQSSEGYTELARAFDPVVREGGLVLVF